MTDNRQHQLNWLTGRISLLSLEDLHIIDKAISALAQPSELLERIRRDRYGGSGSGHDVEDSVSRAYASGWNHCSSHIAALVIADMARGDVATELPPIHGVIREPTAEDFDSAVTPPFGTRPSNDFVRDRFDPTNRFEFDVSDETGGES